VAGGAELVARGGDTLGRLAGRPLPIAQPKERLLKVAAALSESEPKGLYRQLISHWRNPEEIVLGASRELPDLAADVPATRDLAELIEHLMAVDSSTYLPEDILVKVDRAAMST